MSYGTYTYMSKQETPEEIKKWFLSQVARLWPVASGSLSLRKNRCIRKHCPTCESGEGHPSYALYIPSRKGRSVIYVPDDLAESLASALANGRKLQDLMREAGERYLKAMKATRRKP